MRVIAFAIVLFWAGAAQAADLTVSVRTPRGQPIADAVVMVEPAGGAAARPIRFDRAYRMAQQDMRFEPFVLIVPAGATVAFPNLDTVRHHVYSFSAPRPFEIKLYGKDESRSVRFDKPGVIAVGCNIHDRMLAFIRVVSTPWAAKTDARGQARIRGAAGRATLRVWHPYLRAPRNEVARAVDLPREGTAAEAVTAEVRAPPRRHHGY